jgi:hypothetical protein
MPEDSSRYTSQRRRFFAWYVFAALGLAATALIAALRGHFQLVGAMLVALGLLAWVFPLATPAALEHLGTRLSVSVTRLGAVVLLIIGIWLCLNSCFRS